MKLQICTNATRIQKKSVVGSKRDKDADDGAEHCADGGGDRRDLYNVKHRNGELGVELGFALRLVVAVAAEADGVYGVIFDARLGNIAFEALCLKNVRYCCIFFSLCFSPFFYLRS